MSMLLNVVVPIAVMSVIRRPFWALMKRASRPILRALPRRWHSPLTRELSQAEGVFWGLAGLFGLMLIAGLFF